MTNLPCPRWYDISASAAPKQSLDSLRPVPWATIVDEALGQPISTSSAVACGVTADALVLRLQGDFVVSRGLFVTDLGRLVAWHALNGDPNSATRAALSVAIAAVRKCRLLANSASVLAHAERIGNDDGMASFLDQVDRELMDTEATRTNSRWEGLKWDSPHSAKALLHSVVEMGYRCGKSETAILGKWASLVDDARRNYGFTPLLNLTNSYVNRIDEFPSISSLVAALQRDSFAGLSLDAMRAERVSSAPQPSAIPPRQPPPSLPTPPPQTSTVAVAQS